MALILRYFTEFVFHRICVWCRRNKSSRSLSHLLTSFLLVTILTCSRHPAARWHLSSRRQSGRVMCGRNRRSAKMTCKKHCHAMLFQLMARPDGSMHCGNRLDGPSKLSVDTQKSLEIHQYLPQPVREPAPQRMQALVICRSTFFANNFTVLVWTQDP